MENFITMLEYTPKSRMLTESMGYLYGKLSNCFPK